jgi:hypothetical protein
LAACRPTPTSGRVVHPRLTALAEDLELDSVWTLDRIVVQASDRQELQYPFGMMTAFPRPV